ncbi:hypothetical protein N2605_04990 [Bradyrhizobium yuanmingense]|uniref:hypothetical protein n=1 Tax=Bradyrhizobium yuanmingense TaxID=108015 RepID=UPI0021A2EBFF|nr:hypothetical protein [Bradyrhizobium sp. CB1024]UWU85821.1 hypothetical protein N2605_04990 [Bradyrhizobium sp. CB1024]
MRGEIRRAENVVTVLTYERTNCPILNQVPHPMRRYRCTSGCSLKFEALPAADERNIGSLARVSSDFYLWLYVRICGESCRLAARFEAAMQFPRPHLVPATIENKLGKKCRALLLA